MSKTPRTDEHLRMKEENGHTVKVSSEFARRLETELSDKDRQLADARAEIERLKLTAGELNGAFNARAKCEKCKAKDKLLEQMREALKACAEFIHYYDQEHNIGDGKVLEQATAALLAAERGEG